MNINDLIIINILPIINVFLKTTANACFIVGSGKRGYFTCTTTSITEVTGDYYI